MDRYEQKVDALLRRHGYSLVRRGMRYHLRVLPIRGFVDGYDPTLHIEGRPYRLDKPAKLTKLQSFVAQNYHRGADVLASELNRTPIAIEFAYARAKRAMRARDAMLSERSTWRLIFNTPEGKGRVLTVTGALQSVLVEFSRAVRPSVTLVAVELAEAE